MLCPSCQTALHDAGRFCPHCAAALGNHDGATQTISVPPRKPPLSSHGSASGEGRYPAGTSLGDRYRILGLLGRGGMGEVYRAIDLKLNHPVALKFLPEATVRNPRLLDRFHGEVRIARQVSHPNVCRVYDLGEIEGSPYISMEYVDGDDLGVLLRRIGRLPGDKALEIARKLCAGLAAAHAKGVLHRDLKPANIMIDGHGQLIIMDFGLAALADEIEGAEIRNGTPAYMAPEQIAGKEVTERSDIYSLGLVLYEMFTGKRAFETRDRSTVPSAASVIKDIDPEVERLIARCLDPDPARRPQTALSVARALPGGDPLAEALAAGETPSPEMVAASDDTGALSVRQAVVCMGVVVAGLIASLAIGGPLRLIPFPDSPEILMRQGREIATRLGYTNPPADESGTFYRNEEYRLWAERNLKIKDYREQVGLGQPPLIGFSYRGSPGYMSPRGYNGIVSDDDPPLTTSGMVWMDLDPQGRLIRFLGVPPQVDDMDAAAGSPALPMQWNKLFDAAGLDPARWTTTPSKEIPPFSFDERKAWTGTFPHSPTMPMRIEAAAFRGRPVSFDLVGPWWRPERTQSGAPVTASERSVAWLFNSLVMIALSTALWLAVKNVRAGRGDSRGALRFAAAGLLSEALAMVVAAHHVAGPKELDTLSTELAWALFLAAMSWVFYTALEPWLRRRWPQSLISWARFLAGQLRDPLVSGHILAGVAIGVCVALIEVGADSAGWRSQGLAAIRPTLPATLDGSGAVALLLSMVIEPAAFVMGLTVLVLLFRLVVRNVWVASAIPVVLIGWAIFVQGSGPAVAVAVATEMGVCLLVLIRYGMLPAILTHLTPDLLSSAPITSDFSAWYAGKGLIAVALDPGDRRLELPQLARRPQSAECGFPVMRARSPEVPISRPADSRLAGSHSSK